jgi:hypothetical protein
MGPLLYNADAGFLHAKKSNALAEIIVYYQSNFVYIYTLLYFIAY